MESAPSVGPLGEDEESLVREYKTTRNPIFRNAVVLRFERLAKRYYGKYGLRNSGITYEEWWSDAGMKLIELMDAFSPERVGDSGKVCSFQHFANFQLDCYARARRWREERRNSIYILDKLLEKPRPEFASTASAPDAPAATTRVQNLAVAEIMKSIDRSLASMTTLEPARGDRATASDRLWLARFIVIALRATGDWITLHELATMEICNRLSSREICDVLDRCKQTVRLHFFGSVN